MNNGMQAAQTTQDSGAAMNLFAKLRQMGFAEIYRRYGTMLIFIGIFHHGVPGQ